MDALKAVCAASHDLGAEWAAMKERLGSWKRLKLEQRDGAENPVELCVPGLATGLMLTICSDACCPNGRASVAAAAVAPSRRSHRRRRPSFPCAAPARSNLQECGLLDLPDAVGQLPHLRKLWLTHNALRGLPGGVARLGRLQALLAGNNVMKELPPVRRAEWGVKWQGTIVQWSWMQLLLAHHPLDHVTCVQTSALVPLFFFYRCSLSSPRWSSSS